MAISNEVARKLAALLANTEHLEEKIRHIKPEELSSERLLDSLWDIKLIVDKLVDELEFQDENMDPEKTKLDLTSVDALFPEHPVTDFVSARFDYAKGDQSPEVISKMMAAAKKLREEQAAPTGEDLLMRVRSVDELFTYEISDLLTAIEDDLGAKQDYSLSDLDLIRFYLEHLPYNSKFDIEEMSDAEVAREWSRIMANRKN